MAKEITVAGAVRVDKRTDWSRYRWWDKKQEAKAVVGRHYYFTQRGNKAKNRGLHDPMPL
jgi:hypothetical protein